MARKKNDIKDYLDKDLARFGGKTPSFKEWLLHSESYYIWSYIYHMRMIEYHQASGNKIRYVWHWFRLKRLQFKLHFAIYPNTIGPGFRIYHVGNYVHVGPNVKIGRNCTMVSGVVFGNKTEADDERPVTVGDNCYLGLDCKILGPVKIGNNVTIGANAIVTKDIPDGATVVGVNKLIIR